MSDMAKQLLEMANGMETRCLVGMAHGTRQIADSVAAIESQLAALKEENEWLKFLSDCQKEQITRLQSYTSRDYKHIKKLNARVAELVTIGKEMASDLEDAICARYGVNVARLHPALVNNFKRDLDVVYRFRQKVDMEEPANEK